MFEPAEVQESLKVHRADYSLLGFFIASALCVFLMIKTGIRIYNVELLAFLHLPSRKGSGYYARRMGF